jgi:hypothetical protein
LDAANEVMLQYRAGKIQKMEAFEKLQGSVEEVNTLAEKHPRPDVQKAAATLTSQYETLSAEIFKSKKTALPPKF